MPENKWRRYEAKFPHGEHGDCRTLTSLTIEHLPPDGSVGRVRRYRQTANVWQRGERSDHLYFLRHGQIALVTEDKDGREILIRLVGKGEPFGELCFCGGPTAYRSTTARAIVASEVVEIKLPDFIDYIGKNRDALAALVFTFCIRLAEAEQRIEVLVERSAEKRLGKLLLHLASARLKSDGADAGAVIVALSHEQLARMAAMSRQQVTITMGHFRRLGLLHYERGRPPVINVEALNSHLEESS
jgi:CRP/FNR family transcriptional regulator, cyclic AMP receptor protein